MAELLSQLPPNVDVEGMLMRTMGLGGGGSVKSQGGPRGSGSGASPFGASSKKFSPSVLAAAVMGEGKRRDL